MIGYVVSDQYQNIQIYKYDLNTNQTFRHKQLMIENDYYVGKYINKMKSLLLSNSYLYTRNKQIRSTSILYQQQQQQQDLNTTSTRHNANHTLPAAYNPYETSNQFELMMMNNPPKSVIINGTLTGIYSIIIPIDRKSYYLLFSLFVLISYTIPQLAGLNPRAYRLLKSNTHIPKSYHKGMVDGNILSEIYTSLDIYQQSRLAKTIGTTKDHLIHLLSILDNTL